MDTEIKEKYLKAWKPTIFATGLIFSDAIVDNAIMGNLMRLLGFSLGANTARNAIFFAIQMSLTSLMAIVGSFLTDAYFGKFQMIKISTIIYIIALLIIPCLERGEAAKSVYVSCFLLATGRGCFQWLLQNQGEDQINAHYEGKKRAKVLQQIWWWTPTFLGSTVGSILLLISERIDWLRIVWTIPGVMVVAFILFLCGKSSYNLNNDKSPRAPLIRVIRVFVAAALNRHLRCPVNTTHLHENPEEGHEHLLPHTNTLRCLDKAAIHPSKQGADKNTIPPSQQDTEKNKEEENDTKKMNWRLCRVTEVEENKLLLGKFPIWATLLVWGIVLSLQQTLFIEQAYNMERRLGSVSVPVTSLFLLTGLSKAAIYGFQLVPLKWKTILGHEIIPKKVQIGLGMFSSILCCMTASLVESRRLHAYNCKGCVSFNLSIYWLIPQFFLIGAMDGLFTCGVKDFFNDHCMKSFEYSFSQSVLASGHFLFAVLAIIMNNTTKWFGKDMNSSRVDYFYWGLGMLSFINLCIYACISRRVSPMEKSNENYNISNNNKTGNDNGNNNDKGEATTSAEERTTTIETATVKQQE